MLPHGLEETYDGVLRRIMSSNPDRIEELKFIFRWLIGGECILNLEELAEAVSISPEDRVLDLDGIATDPEDLAAFGSSLVTVERNFDPPPNQLCSLLHRGVPAVATNTQITNGRVPHGSILRESGASYHMPPISIIRQLC